MPITRRPKPVDVNALINKGGSPARPGQRVALLEGTSAETPVLLRIPEKDLLALDDAVGNRPVRISRNRWILEAIQEKVLRESARRSVRA